MSADRDGALRLLEAACEAVWADLATSRFGKFALAAPVVRFRDRRRSPHRAKFYPDRWDDRSGRRRDEYALSEELLDDPHAIVTALAHLSVHHACRVEAPKRRAWICRTYHSQPFGEIAREAGFRVPDKADRKLGFDAMGRTAAFKTELVNLSSRIAAALAVRAVPVPPVAPGRNLRAFACCCEPPRRVRSWDDISDVLCPRCRRPFEPAGSAA